MTAHYATILRIYGANEVMVAHRVCLCPIGQDHDQYGR